MVEDLFSLRSPYVVIDPMSGKYIDSYDIYDKEGYRLLSNMSKNYIKELEAAVKEYNCIDEIQACYGKDALKIKDINVYAGKQGKIVKGKDNYVSVWVKHNHELSKFWSIYEYIVNTNSADKFINSRVTEPDIDIDINVRNKQILQDITDKINNMTDEELREELEKYDIEFVDNKGDN